MALSRWNSTHGTFLRGWSLSPRQAAGPAISCVAGDSRKVNRSSRQRPVFATICSRFAGLRHGPSSQPRRKILGAGGEKIIGMLVKIAAAGRDELGCRLPDHQSSRHFALFADAGDRFLDQCADLRTMRLAKVAH